MIFAVVTVCAALCREIDVQEFPTPMACAMAMTGPHVQATAAVAMRPDERIVEVACKPGKGT